MAIFGFGGFQWLELHTYDMRMNLRGAQAVTSPILLILNNEQTLTHLGISPSRVSRTHYAQAIQHLHQAKAKQIVLDVMFSDEGDPDENQQPYLLEHRHPGGSRNGSANGNRRR